MQLSARLPVLLALLPSAAIAFQPLITDDTGTQGKGGNQVEYGYTRTVEKEPLSKAVTGSHAFTYTRGLAETVDIYLGASRVRFSKSPAPVENGAGNAVAGLKWRFHEDEARKMSLAFRPEVRLPISDDAENRGLGNARANASATFILTRETGFGALHANLAWSSNHFALPANRDIHRRGLWRLSLAPVFDLSSDWKLAFDVGLVTNPHRGEKASMAYAEIGTIWSPDENLDIAIGLSRDLRHQGHSVDLATAGITWRFR